MPLMRNPELHCDVGEKGIKGYSTKSSTTYTGTKPALVGSLGEKKNEGRGACNTVCTGTNAYVLLFD